VGTIFIFATMEYFVREFIADLPDIIKLVLLIVSVAITFATGEGLRGE